MGKIVRAALAAAATFALICAACGQTAAQAPAAGAAAPAAAAIPAPEFETSGNPDFDVWRADFARRAIAAGRDRAIVVRVLTGLSPDPRIVELDQRQPEFVAPVWDYITRRLSQQRIEAGRALKAELGATLPAVAQRYGVDGDIILGIWGLESNYGQAALDYDAGAALATLAAEGRRRAQFETYLLALIEMVERGLASGVELKASWAGALGQPQFMPDVYLSTAVDWNNDGKRDIWNDRADVAASIAHYLQDRGWRANEPVFDEVRLPAGIEYGLADGTERPLSFWINAGVARIDGAAWSDAARDRPAQLYLPAGAQGPVLLLYPNFAVIRRYNASDRYALAVALLGRAYAGEGGLVTAWPTQLGALQRDEILQLQILLSNLGHSAGVADGQFGANTRRAVAAFQRTHNLVADGFPTPQLLRLARLTAGVDVEEPLPAPTPLARAGIRDLQRLLARLGYSPGAADGRIGDRTRGAIRAFERSRDLPVTGRATARVLEAARRATR